MAHLVFACDEAYAMPLATMLRSLVDTNRRLWPLEATVLTPGLDEATHARVEASLPAGALRIGWATIDTAPFRGFTTLAHVSSVTFARLVMQQALPAGVERVLYLDVDMLVLADLGPLIQHDMRGRPIAAVPDLNVDEDRLTGSGTGPAGLPQVERYFNAGVLLIDMAACAQAQVFERAIAFLQSNPRTPYGDQDALNVACDGLWDPLDARWNFQGHRSCRLAELSADRRPGIVHFISGAKPWIPRSCSLNARFYDAHRSRTAFARSTFEAAEAAAATLHQRVLNRFVRMRRGPVRPAVA